MGILNLESLEILSCPFVLVCVWIWGSSQIIFGFRKKASVNFRCNIL